MLQKTVLGLIAVTFLVSGCNSIRNTFGLDHYQADEMKVEPNPPLTIPPNFKLRPPKPGAPNPNQRDHATEAESVITGQSDKTVPAKVISSSSKTEDIVLSQAAAQS